MKIRKAIDALKDVSACDVGVSAELIAIDVKARIHAVKMLDDLLYEMGILKKKPEQVVRRSFR